MAVGRESSKKAETKKEYGGKKNRAAGSRTNTTKQENAKRKQGHAAARLHAWYLTAKKHRWQKSLRRG